MLCWMEFYKPVRNAMLIDKKCSIKQKHGWLTPSRTTLPSTLFLPAGFSILRCPQSTRGSSTAVLNRENLKVRQVNTVSSHESFEFLKCTVMLSVTMRLCVVYRPPGSRSKNFNEEFAGYMSRLVTSHGQLLVVGDFNFHINKSSKFLSSCQSFNITQDVSLATHSSGNTLNLVMAQLADILVSSVTSCDYGFPVFVT